MKCLKLELKKKIDMMSQVPLPEIKKHTEGEEWNVIFAYPLLTHGLNLCGEKWDGLSQFSPISLLAPCGVSVACTFN